MEGNELEKNFGRKWLFSYSLALAVDKIARQQPSKLWAAGSIPAGRTILDNRVRKSNLLGFASLHGFWYLDQLA